MIIEIGHFALLLACGLAALQMVVPIWGGVKNNVQMMQVASPASLGQLVFLLIAFFSLMYAYVTSDFSVVNVAQNSHSTKPLLYKISGVWGNHEGSMLLWVLILAIFGAAVTLFGNNLPMRLKANVLAVQASIAFAFLLFIIATSNPFTRQTTIPADGNGLNPILQDPALAFHPPFLYMGYVGFSMAFSFAVAALIEGRIDAAWARWVRPWTLAAWMFLTLGIAMGSWWAYYELGWGGWWFWDPVENASFMPWLAGTALLHSALVMEKRDALKIWTILLAILTFSLSLMGAFLVRSGVLTSVHAFAVDPERGVVILLIMAIFIGGALTLFALRAPSLKQGGLFAPISREGSLVFNNLILTTACASVFIGTLYPLILETINGAKISVGPPFFNATFVPLMMPLLLAVPFGPFLAWKRGDLYAASQRLFAAFIIALLGVIFFYALYWRGPWLAPLVMGVAIWIMVGAISELLYRSKFMRADWSEFFRRLSNLPRSAYGTACSHFGLGVCVLGIVATSAWQQEKVLTLSPGGKVDLGSYQLKLEKIEMRQGPNYREQFGVFSVFLKGEKLATLEPAKRKYNAQNMDTTEAGILARWSGDLYVVLGDHIQGANVKPQTYSVRVYFHPFVRLIWIGAMIMFLGGALSLADRRLRIGAPKRSARQMAHSVAAE